MQFKGRASQNGSLMTNPRSKSETLSQTTKTYLQEWQKEQIYGVRNDINSKYLTKGIDMEDESINIYALHTDLDFAVKNSQRFTNDFITGEPDLILDDKVVDIKTSWDCFTFPLFDTEITNKNYYWQLQSYMALTGKYKAELAYVLVNTPEYLQYSELDAHDYTNLDLKYRVKVFEIERNDDDIARLYDRVKECREYLNQITK